MRYSRVLPILLALFAAAPASASDNWRFVCPMPGDPFEHPPLRALSLAASKPEDLVEKVAYRGKRRRYSQLRYGSTNSVRVTVVVDEVGPGDVDLYVDSDRNRRIEPRDKVEAGTGKDRRTWRLPLKLAMVRGEQTDFEPRAVVFRLGATGVTFSFAPRGYLEGAVSIGGRSHLSRRFDGDGNGLVTDPQDSLWIDLNGDGRFDPSNEQFLYAPILTLDGIRYSVRSDAMGQRLALTELEGTGSVRLSVKRGKAIGLSATIVGRDGSVVSVAGEDNVIVPIGEYRLGTVSVILKDPAGGESWSFVFSDSGLRGQPVWHAVPKDGRCEIDPIGMLDLRVGLNLEGASLPGAVLELQPRLFNGDGLLIVTANRGTSTSGEDGPIAAITLESATNPRLDSARSGFA
jgi:hypothetical protein